jgi:hypothetical protein
MTIGLVLGGTFADNVHLTQQIYGWHFLTRSPLADVFFAIAIVLLAAITWRGRRRGEAVVTPQRAARGPRSPHPVLEPVTEAVIAVVSIVYLIIALGYPTDAGRIPAIVSGLAAALALARLATWAVKQATARRQPAEASPEVSPKISPEPAMATSAPSAVAVGALALDGTPPPGPDGIEAEPLAPADRRRRIGREFAALAWIWAAIVLSYLFGFQIGVPVVAAAYCLTSIDWTRQWQRLTFALSVTVVALGIAVGFVSLFHLTFTGLLA